MVIISDPDLKKNEQFLGLVLSYSDNNVVVKNCGFSTVYRDNQLDEKIQCLNKKNIEIFQYCLVNLQYDLADQTIDINSLFNPTSDYHYFLSSNYLRSLDWKNEEEKSKGLNYLFYKFSYLNELEKYGQLNFAQCWDFGLSTQTIRQSTDNKIAYYSMKSSRIIFSLDDYLNKLLPEFSISLFEGDGYVTFDNNFLFETKSLFQTPLNEQKERVNNFKNYIQNLRNDTLENFYDKYSFSEHKEWLRSSIVRLGNSLIKDAYVEETEQIKNSYDQYNIIAKYYPPYEIEQFLGRLKYLNGLKE